ncbi:septum formation protein Maf [Flavobacteriaceae bacterium TP-CH-4]|uniref:dTTP/UTP pyrophosphatase n=1 Tax=Pelagihabitans pacificus TaxID=2696054 RepID=A0A967AUM3_9FLAO|nr:Maf-like protein [Pelagihabitans pacificus]NHF60247.1 septum formation protein Maf [Pelagihabitans pacificus]
MLQDRLRDYRIILASGSPRRQQFFKELGLDFEIRLQPTEEVYPPSLKGNQISDYLAELKASAFDGTLAPNEILITSDTVVWHNDTSLAKPADSQEAFKMLKTLSGDWHEVITSICFATIDGKRTVHDTTRVKFKPLTNDEIQYYIDQYQPYDKAGAYGIQEWLGHTAIEQIQGSYTNVMGLPTHILYKTLTDMAG